MIFKFVTEHRISERAFSDGARLGLVFVIFAVILRLTIPVALEVGQINTPTSQEFLT